MKGTAFVGGVPVGPGKYRGTWQFLGFEDVTTPVATWPDTARVQVAASMRVKIRANRNVIEVFLSRTAWYAQGIGEVASSEAAVTGFLKGVLETEIPPRTGCLESGTWWGEPIP